MKSVARESVDASVGTPTRFPDPGRCSEMMGAPAVPNVAGSDSASLPGRRGDGTGSTVSIDRFSQPTGAFA
jgi:hypothetical protein